MNTEQITITLPTEGLFIVTRTSEGFISLDDDPRSSAPCPEAFKATVRVVDRRSVDHPSKLTMGEKTWYERGTNHRIENGHIYRDLGIESVWVVAVSDIVAFVDKHGDVIVSRNNNGFATLEIYDTYRE